MTESSATDTYYRSDLGGFLYGRELYVPCNECEEQFRQHDEDNVLLSVCGNEYSCKHGHIALRQIRKSMGVPE